MRDIEKKLARSSLGTPSAVAARRSITKIQAGKVVARSAALRTASRSFSKHVGGKR